MPDVEFYGETFHIGEPSEFALMEFADTSESVDENSMPGLAALYRLLRDCVLADPVNAESKPEKEWDRFKAVARKNRASSDTLLPVVVAAVNAAADRPTERPSVSSDGPAPTLLRSVSPPADPAMERLSGRPDLQLAVQMSRRQTASA